MQYPWVVSLSLKFLGHVLDYSLAPKFLWQMVLKQIQNPVTSSPFDGGKEGGKGVMQL